MPYSHAENKEIFRDPTNSFVRLMTHFKFVTPGMGFLSPVRDEETAREVLLAAHLSLKYHVKRTVELENENRRLKAERAVIRNFFAGFDDED